MIYLSHIKNTDSIRYENGDLTMPSYLKELASKLKAVFGRKGVIPGEVVFSVTWKSITKRPNLDGAFSGSRRKNLEKVSHKPSSKK